MTQLHQCWHDNAPAWTRVVRERAIESRRLATDDAIVRAVLVRRPARVLDLGCGEGWLARTLGEHGPEVVGVDASAPLIEAARDGGGGTFHHLSYRDLVADPGVCGGAFDVVVANFALLEERIEPLLRTIRRLLAPGGWFLIQTVHPFAADLPYRNGWRIEEFEGFGEGAWTPMPWYYRTFGSWVTLLHESGFALYGLSEPVHPQTGRPLSLLLETYLPDAWV